MGDLELVVFRSSEAARYAGFSGLGPHAQDERLHAWWPALDADRLRGLDLARITLASDAFRDCSLQVRAEALTILRSRLRVAPMIWMEL